MAKGYHAPHGLFRDSRQTQMGNLGTVLLRGEVLEGGMLSLEYAL